MNFHSSLISAPKLSWKIVLDYELEDIGVDKSLKWPASILSAIRQFTPIRPEKSFHGFSRWYEFSILPSSDIALQYNPLSHQPAYNFFDQLAEDLRCPDNPISVIILAFSQGFISDFHDPLQDLLTAPSEACSLYAKMLDSTLKFKALAYKLICEFYTCVGDIIQSRLEDVEALLLTCIVQGEVYRLLYTAACISQASRSADVRHAFDRNSLEEALNSDTASGLEATVKSLRLLGASESPFEKVAHLYAAVMMINEITADSRARTKLLANAIVKSKLATALAHTQLIEDFAGSRQSRLTSVLREGVEELVQLFKLKQLV
jgi:hypothetical protein